MYAVKEEACTTGKIFKNKLWMGAEDRVVKQARICGPQEKASDQS